MLHFYQLADYYFPTNKEQKVDYYISSHSCVANDPDSLPHDCFSNKPKAIPNNDQIIFKFNLDGKQSARLLTLAILLLMNITMCLIWFKDRPYFLFSSLAAIFSFSCTNAPFAGLGLLAIAASISINRSFAFCLWLAPIVILFKPIAINFSHIPSLVDFNFYGSLFLVSTFFIMWCQEAFFNRGQYN